MSILNFLFGRKKESVADGYKVSKSDYKELSNDETKSKLYEASRTFMLDYSQDFDDEAHKDVAMKEVLSFTKIPWANPRTKEMRDLKRSFKRELKSIERDNLQFEVVRVANILTNYRDQSISLRAKQKK